MGNVLQFKQKPAREQDSAAKGFALLHRKITDVPFYKTDSEAVHMWLHVILMANYAPKTVMTQLGEISIGRGQFITGRTSLVTETGIKSDRVKYLLNKFVKLGMIHMESTKFFTKITVIKYDDYQLNLVPTECQQNANVKSGIARCSEEVVPAECQQSATTNEVLNISITNVIDCDSAGADTPSQQEVIQQTNPAKKKSSLSCEDVVSVYHDILPEAKGVRALTDRRRNMIRTFWAKASKITRQLDGQPFTLESWKSYLTYVATNCRWMLEDRQDNRSGKTWHKKGLDYFLNDEVYLQVREGGKDDR
ncbi:replication protein O [Leminorella grimontii]|uniref:Replication protein O n=1 Tax=Leminorella grimontii TaxID=82981 RepID=A0AAV5N0V0_9GAMM|nr:phage replication initiation protein [Leminorella grimontii ATCC 33999 = DSM 5078]GKX54077.1 replication protein O [Leminorella grimontii]VFS60136.1 Uncharacterised protein [Leminorella grimontii]